MNLTAIVEFLAESLRKLAPALKKADSVEGNKELRELVKGANVVSLYLAKKFSDGVQFTDFLEFYSDLKSDLGFQQVIKDAYDGHDKFAAEGKDLDAGEGMELLADQIEYVDDYVALFVKADPEPLAKEAPADPEPLVDEAPADAEAEEPNTAPEVEESAPESEESSEG